MFGFHVDLGSPDAAVPNVSVELASGIFEFVLRMQTVHSFGIVAE